MAERSYLFIVPQLGFRLDGGIVPGGLLQHGRCVARALASCAAVRRLGVWSQVDTKKAEPFVRRMIEPYAHRQLRLDVRLFGGSRTRLAASLAAACWSRHFDRVIYLLVNQAVLSYLPRHPPYIVWEIGEELFFRQVSRLKLKSLMAAELLLSNSENTTFAATKANPRLPKARVVHLCLEPGTYSSDLFGDGPAQGSMVPHARQPAVLIVGNMHHNMLYKGHQELVAAWPEVVKSCPEAELWIVGDGDGRIVIEADVASLEADVRKQISFLGQVPDDELERLYRSCRVFAMPSRGEGFGLVFVEAARFAVPAIGGKMDAVKEIVLDGKTGFLVDQLPEEIARACLRLLTDDELTKQMGEAAYRRYSEKFRFEHFRFRLLGALDLLE